MAGKNFSKICKSILLVVFLITSVVLLIPQKNSPSNQMRHQSLSKRITTEGKIERIDYIDNNGAITFAADVGYATMIATMNDESSRIEHFYNEAGEPISRYPGFYALLREYDDKGHNYRTVYLDRDDLPTITVYGYSEKWMTFYDTGRVKTEKYFDPMGNEVCTSTYGCGFLNEYDENGRVIKITYLNEADEPMRVGLGYAIVTRYYYNTDQFDDNKVEFEYYFDEKQEPVALSLGQFGVRKEYDENGQVSVITYLDQYGSPIVTNKGYTTVTKTYYANNFTATELYFDIEGNPFALSEGQYGILKENDQIIYLDINGKEIYNFKRLLYNQSWIVILCSMIIMIISTALSKKWNAVLLFAYILVIIYMTLMFRSNISYKTGFTLQWSYWQLFSDNEVRTDMLRNIWLFIPLGIIFFQLYPKKIILFVPVAFSIIIEGIQYISQTGFCEINDVLSNGLGGIIGYCAENMLKDRIMVRASRRIRLNT